MRKFVIGMAMASTALTVPAAAREGQWYIEGAGGVMIVEDVQFDINGNLNNAEAGYDVGYDFGASVGHDFGIFRLEAEASYRAADADTLSAGSLGIPAIATRTQFQSTFPAAGEINMLSFMLNGMFDFGPDDGLQGFVGGGIGVARVDVEGTINTTGPGFINDSDTGLAWQLLAGVRAPLSDNWDVGLRYRYFNAEDVNLVDTRGFDLVSDVKSHSILGTITNNFGGAPEPIEVAPPPPPPVAVVPPPPPPVTRPPVAPPPAPPPCNTGPYIVFFDFDESAITAEAANTLDQAVSAYANCGTASVMLAGHTDRAGSVRYNIGLAERRNTAVATYLTGKGIPGSRISSAALGESQPRVDTPDGVREQENRRVEVNYGPGSGM